jgi:hypothetical protein
MTSGGQTASRGASEGAGFAAQSLPARPATAAESAAARRAVGAQRMDKARRKGAPKAAASTAEHGKAADEYQWLHPTPLRARHGYVRNLGGGDMPRANEFRGSAKFSFGSGRRFNHAVYQPQNPGSNVAADASPGPVYTIPDTLRGPMCSFAPSGAKPGSTSTRRLVELELARTVREDIPGPGSYLIRPEDRAIFELTGGALFSAGVGGGAGHAGSSRPSSSSASSPQRPAGDPQPPSEGAAGSPPPLGHSESAAAAAADRRGVKQPSFTTQLRAVREFTEKLHYGLDAEKPSAPRVYFSQGGARTERLVEQGSPSPGPGAYEVKERPVSPAVSFGGLNVVRNNITYSADVVGPLAYECPSMMGKQLLSTRVSAPAVRFTGASRDQVGRLYMPGGLSGTVPPAAESPPPGTPMPESYIDSSFGPQVLSSRAASPTIKFTTAAAGEKALGGGKDAQLPGPGAYGNADSSSLKPFASDVQKRQQRQKEAERERLRAAVVLPVPNTRRG